MIRNQLLLKKKKKKNREESDKQIKKRENELIDLDNEIHKSLNDSINKLSFIAAREKELNKIALKKYENDKYGFCKKILDETIQENRIKTILNQTLDNIECISSSTEQKEECIKEIQKYLSTSSNN